MRFQVVVPKDNKSDKKVGISMVLILKTFQAQQLDQGDWEISTQEIDKLFKIQTAFRKYMEHRQVHLKEE